MLCAFRPIVLLEVLRFMRISRQLALCSAILLASALPAVASPHVRRGPTAPRMARTHAHVSRSSRAAVREHSEPVGMAPERATEIQSALIKSGYMSGTPSGAWDSTTQAAMFKYQTDMGLTTRVAPDARALIKLGLGPKTNTASAETPDSPGTHASN